MDSAEAYQPFEISLFALFKATKCYFSTAGVPYKIIFFLQLVQIPND